MFTLASLGSTPRAMSPIVATARRSLLQELAAWPLWRSKSFWKSTAADISENFLKLEAEISPIRHRIFNVPPRYGRRPPATQYKFVEGILWPLHLAQC